MTTADSPPAKPRRLPPAAGMGRKKGVPNRRTALLRDAILIAAEKAGDTEGMVGYLEQQARKNPRAFLGLLAKLLPKTVVGESGEGPVQIELIRRVIVDPSVEDEARDD